MHTYYSFIPDMNKTQECSVVLYICLKRGCDSMAVLICTDMGRRTLLEHKHSDKVQIANENGVPRCHDFVFLLGRNRIWIIVEIMAISLID